jgi:hypothetical protein
MAQRESVPHLVMNAVAAAKIHGCRHPPDGHIIHRLPVKPDNSSKTAQAITPTNVD